MATYTQSNNSVSSSYYNFFLSKVPDGEDFIIFATEDNYICIYGNYDSGNKFEDTTVIKISRTYGNQGTVTYSDETTSNFSISYEYYIYSNIGVGTFISSPRVSTNALTHDVIQTSLLLTLLFCFIGFNVIKKRWIR